ncbi:MAG: hypothetical protein NUV67_02625 [archaeon]|nr:hypothetical protein [archaeon]
MNLPEILILLIAISGCASQIETGEDFCESDSDCTLMNSTLTTEGNGCCNECGVEPASKAREIERNEWRAQNCQAEYSICPIYDCVLEKRPKATCINNLCAIRWEEK